jgi:hypothetical protein
MPLNVTVEVVKNPVPLIVIDAGLEPVETDDGERLVIDGVGL